MSVLVVIEKGCQRLQILVCAFPDLQRPSTPLSGLRRNLVKPFFGSWLLVAFLLHSGFLFVVMLIAAIAASASSKFFLLCCVAEDNILEYGSGSRFQPVGAVDSPPLILTGPLENAAFMAPFAFVLRHMGICQATLSSCKLFLVQGWADEVQ